MNRPVCSRSPSFSHSLTPIPNHHFPAVHQQLFDGGPVGKAPMAGFVKSYYRERQDVDHSRKIMYYFAPDKLPVLTALASNFASSTVGSRPSPAQPLQPRLRALRHVVRPGLHGRFLLSQEAAEHLSSGSSMPVMLRSVFYYDEASSSLEVVNLLQNQPKLFGTFDDFHRRLQAQQAFAVQLHRAELLPTMRTTAAKSSPATSIPTTTSNKARSSSRPSTTRFAQNPDAMDEHGHSGAL